MSKRSLNLILSIASLILLIFALFSRTSEKKYKTENFRGRPYSEVVRWMEINGIPSEDIIFNYVFHESIPRDTVISQNLNENSLIYSKSPLVVSVSKGIDPDQRIVLPDFTGLDKDEITEWSTENGVEVTFINKINEDKEEGIFLASDPISGTRITRDQLVRVAICIHDHSPTVPLPDFTGKKKDEIQKWADKYNIEVNYIYYYDASPEDTFLYSDIEAGTEIDKGGYISVAISSGPGQ